MLEMAQHVGLARETFEPVTRGERGVDHLQRATPLWAFLTRLVDDAHAAGAHQPHDLVGADAGR